MCATRGWVRELVKPCLWLTLSPWFADRFSHRCHMSPVTFVPTFTGKLWILPGLLQCHTCLYSLHQTNLLSSHKQVRNAHANVQAVYSPYITTDELARSHTHKKQTNTKPYHPEKLRVKQTKKPLAETTNSWQYGVQRIPTNKFVNNNRITQQYTDQTAAMVHY